MEIAADTGVEQPGRVARIARIQILKARRQLGLEGPKASDLGPCFGEASAIGVAHETHRAGSRRGLLPLPHDRLNLAQREAEILELPDPPDPDEPVLPIQSKVPLGPSVR